MHNVKWQSLRAAWILIAAMAMAPASAYAADPGEGDLQRMQQFIEVMQGYYQIIGDMHSVASDPDKSAILQLQKIEEIYKQRGDRAEAIKVLQDVISKTTSPIVRNAASMMLADALNETGRASQAVEVLQEALHKNLQ